MKMWDNFLKRAKPIDIGLLKLSSLVFGIFLAALFPQLLINPWILLIIAIIIAIKPMYLAFKK
ncbi:MAG: hypothetical protein JSW73_00965 [Candidatus Woesearchaeota archaeon]|nr:MAG: hypothetical protein JSW73_00965 [Candidatus Woesearchaeota archaeon]